jgi:uncharacterized protein
LGLFVFTWDPEKDESNRLKHRVTFREASTVFADPLAKTIYDEAHSQVEEPYVTIGNSSAGQLLVVAHTDRDDTVRIISARFATAREREAYEESV